MSGTRPYNNVVYGVAILILWMAIILYERGLCMCWYVSDYIIMFYGKIIASRCKV